MRKIQILLLIAGLTMLHPVVNQFPHVKVKEVELFKLKIEGIPYPNILEYRNFILKYSKQYKLPPRLLNNILGHESGFNPQAINYNRNGSMDVGIAQINSKYLEYYQSVFIKDLNPWDVESSIHFCAKYLGYLISHSDSYESAIIAYNRGLRGSKGEGKILGQPYYLSVINWRIK